MLNNGSCPFSANKIISFYRDIKQIREGKYPMPRMLSVWLSQVCNLRCPHCLFKEYNKEAGKFIDAEKFIDFIKEIDKLGIEGIELSGGGEPALHPDCYYIASYIKSRGIKVGMLTNGTRLDNKAILDNFAYIRVSLDACDKETFNKIKQPVNDNVFEEVIENINSLVRDRKSKRPYIGVKVLVSKLNYKTLPNMISFVKSLKVDYLQFKGSHNTEFDLDQSEAKEVDNKLDTYKDLLKNSIEDFYITGRVSRTYSSLKCFTAPTHAVIDSKGNMYICCFFEGRDLCIGNIFKSRFLDIWGKERHLKLMDSIKPEECNKYICRWIDYNNYMSNVLDEDLVNISFI